MNLIDIRARCFCAPTPQKKNGKAHRYFSIVESRRLDGGRVAQRQVLYLGEINDSQEAAWRKSIEVFDEDKAESGQAALFPDDLPIPADEVNALSLVMSDMRLLKPRGFGDCWLGCLLWRELELDQFWREQFDDQRGGVPWEKVHAGIKVKLLEQDNELYVEACGGNRQKKENAMRLR